MAYNIKDVFYLSTSVELAGTSTGGGSAQLDLSAYIDPIARGRQKGTGLAVYKVHWMFNDDTQCNPVDPAETGVVCFQLQAGAGVGDNATGDYTLDNVEGLATNALLVSGGSYYAPSASAGASMSPQMVNMIDPSKDVPYVVVRDNVCLTYDIKDQFTDKQIISCRLEVAQVSLDQATLNQLLRTQTV